MGEPSPLILANILNCRVGAWAGFGNHSAWSVKCHSGLFLCSCCCGQAHLVHNEQNADLQSGDSLISLEVSVGNLVFSLLSQWCRVKDFLKLPFLSQSLYQNIHTVSNDLPLSCPCQLAGAAGRFPYRSPSKRHFASCPCLLGCIMVSALTGSACTLTVLFPLPRM